MQTLNYLVIILIIAGVISVLAFTPLVRKLKIRFYLIQALAIVLFVYVFFGRQIIYLFPDVYGQNSQSSQTLNSLRLSRIFLLDLCPFFAVIAPVFVFLKQKKISGVLAVFGLFGALVTLFGELIFTPVNEQDIVNFIFVGTGNNQIYFMMHFLSLLVSLAIILWDNCFSLISFFYIHVFALIYFSYVALMVSVFKDQITGNTTGILANDWTNGEYKNVATFLNLSNSDPQLVFIVGFSLSYVAILLMTLFANIPTFMEMKKDKIFIKKENLIRKDLELLA